MAFFFLRNVYHFNLLCEFQNIKKEEKTFLKSDTLWLSYVRKKMSMLFESVFSRHKRKLKKTFSIVFFYVLFKVLFYFDEMLSWFSPDQTYSFDNASHKTRGANINIFGVNTLFNFCFLSF